MYLSRSQIINRDSVVWIERKRGESGGERKRVGERGERGMGGVGRWGGASGEQEVRQREGGGVGSDRRADG